MPKLEKSDSFCNYEIEYGTNGLEHTTLFSGFVLGLHKLYKMVSLASLSVTKDNQNSDLYHYNFNTKDNRTWSQELFIENAANCCTVSVFLFTLSTNIESPTEKRRYSNWSIS